MWLYFTRAQPQGVSPPPGREMESVSAGRAAALPARGSDGCKSAERRRSHTVAAGTDSGQRRAPGAAYTVRLSAPAGHFRDTRWQMNHCFAVTLCIQCRTFPHTVETTQFYQIHPPISCTPLSFSSCQKADTRRHSDFGLWEQNSDSDSAWKVFVSTF